MGKNGKNAQTVCLENNTHKIKQQKIFKRKNVHIILRVYRLIMFEQEMKLSEFILLNVSEKAKESTDVGWVMKGHAEQMI